jgi:hypothetical protein
MSSRLRLGVYLTLDNFGSSSELPVGVIRGRPRESNSVPALRPLPLVDWSALATTSSKASSRAFAARPSPWGHKSPSRHCPVVESGEAEWRLFWTLESGAPWTLRGSGVAASGTSTAHPFPSPSRRRRTQNNSNNVRNQTDGFDSTGQPARRT